MRKQLKTMFTYPDIWEYIGNYLESDDLYSLSLTCKSAYKAFKRDKIQTKISFPLIKPKLLTYDQRKAIKKMELLPSSLKLINGNVGSGKTIVSLSYCLRNNFEKIFIAVPPSLVKMWEETCINFFGITPLVLHNTNKKYSAKEERNREFVPEEKIIIFSHKNFAMGFHWFHYPLNSYSSENYILIIDEVHHSLPLRIQFKEVIGLSATMLKYNQLSSGIRNLLCEYEISLEKVSLNLKNNIINKALLPVKALEPHQWELPDGSCKESLKQYIMKSMQNLSVKQSLKCPYDLRDIQNISSELTHTFISKLSKLDLRDHIMIGRKKLHIPSASCKYHYFVGAERIESVSEKEHNDNINKCIDSCIKYKQILSMLQYLKKRKEKAIIFDINVTFLPFLYKYLLDNDVKAYMFTTHYDVGSRQKNLEKFKKQEDAEVLLSSVEMLGEGHNITEANHIIFLSSNITINKYKQAVGRCHRYPQEKTVYVHTLFNSQLDRKIFEHGMGKINLEQEDWFTLLNM